MSVRPNPLPDALRALLPRSARMRTAVLYLLTVVLAFALIYVPTQVTSPMADAERQAFDWQMRLLRAWAPQPLAADVVLIGIDEGSEAIFTEPVALWHRHFAATLNALAIGEPLAVGVDVVPPERSYDDIVPGLDLALFRAIRDLKQKTVVVFALTVDQEGRAARMHGTFAAVLGANGLGIDQQLRDPDFVSRRFSEAELGVGAPAPTLVGQMLRGIGRPVGEGFIDYSVGDIVRYVPMQDVIAWGNTGDVEKLKAAFGGRIVLVGYMLKRADRWELPVKLVKLEEASGRLELSQPGVITHLQTLRSHIANGLLQPVPQYATWLLCLIAAAVVFLRFRPWLLVGGTVLLPSILVVVSLLSIRTQQLIWPLASVVATVWLGFFLRSMLDAVDSVIERTRLKRSFSGQVSPAVLDEIMTGGLEPGSEARTVDVCVIFSDIRGFTTLSEAMAPDQVMSVLQRYFDRMVKSVHRFDGTIDKFIGDGMMILFGAPRPTADPCTDAVRCALDMLDELDALNLEFEKEGMPKLRIGIGINYGKVVVGNIGSTERHNYSAIGDAVNVAARIEGQTKELGRRILITESVVSRIGERFNFEPLGERLVKGHSPVKVWGIRAARSSRVNEAQQGAEEGNAAPIGESS